MRFYLIDRVDELIPGERARGVKNVAMSEDILDQHFPGHPVYPGTLIVEAMAQLGGLLSEVSRNAPGAPIQRAVLVSIDRARFHAPCRPGDQVVLECSLTSSRAGAARVAASARVLETRVAEAGLTFVTRTIDTGALHDGRREVYRAWTRHLTLPFEIL